MKKLLVSLALAAGILAFPADAQKAATGPKAGISAISGEIVTPPVGCVSTSVPFFGSDLKLTCDSRLTFSAGGWLRAADTLTTETVRATSYAAQPKTVTITGSTNATPIVVTATAHGLQTNDLISISGITGNTNANGFFRVTKLTDNTFSLQNYSTGADIAGNGAYGGTPAAVTGIVQANRVMAGTEGTLAQPTYSGAVGPGVGVNIHSAYGGLTAGGVENFWDSSGFTIRGMGYNRVSFASNDDTVIGRAAAATLQLGAANAASPVAQTLKFQDATGSNANAAATATIKAPAGRGTGTRGKLVIQTPQVAASGDNAQTQADRLTIGEDYVDTNIGTGTAVARVGGVLNVNTTSQATTGTSEQVLATYTLPANTLARDGQAVRVTISGTCAANTNNKTIKVRVGGIGGATAISFGTTTSAAKIISTVMVFRTGAAAALSTATSVAGGTATAWSGDPGAITWANANDIVVTGTTATAAGDFTFQSMIVEALN